MAASVSPRESDEGVRFGAEKFAGLCAQPLVCSHLHVVFCVPGCLGGRWGVRVCRFVV